MNMKKLEKATSNRSKLFFKKQLSKNVAFSVFTFLAFMYMEFLKRSFRNGKDIMLKDLSFDILHKIFIFIKYSFFLNTNIIMG